MPASTEALLVNSNLRQAMSFYAGANPEAKLHNLPGLLTVFCGRNYPVFNVGLLNEFREGHLKTELFAASRYYRSLHCGFCFWLCEDLVEPRLLSEIKNTIFPERGFFQLSDPPGMLLRGLPAPARSLPEIEFKPVNDAASRSTFCHLTSHIFDIPFAMANAMYGAQEGWTEEYEAWLGYVNGQPVTLALIVFSEDAAGLYSVGTSASFRKQGFGEATVRWCIARAAQSRGSRNFVLQSSDVGLSLYRRLGFQKVTNFTVFKFKDKLP